ncbi:MAG: hypothetical protein EO766_11810 [Hydrotalea sp. AMD]|uniref:hypothetical protein n=1 Tax=Hydrotalea sp. AMD TaxID=2501297 RepID=UPI001027C9BE|nr:hypothetical protein [Hydrotalea sp. AMD]RWZ87210.1 MAG: hypothetical protein EO766_11810 [Hydrotalea sp. AMD]
MLITENTPIKFAVIVNGVQVGTPQPTKTLAEAIILNLPPQQRQLAEIRPVTTGGAELLLG